MKFARIVFALALLIQPGVQCGSASDTSPKSFTILVGHVVKLSWTASTSTNVVSYRVYVATVSGGPYALIGMAPGTGYSDLNAISGNTYYFVVTAVDSNGLESAYSNEATATIPVP